MSNLWLLAQLRQPTCLLTLSQGCLKSFLSEKNLNLKKELLDDQNVVAPPWSRCLTYEFELRKEACRTARETAVGFSAAWWSAYSSSEHRTLHWLQLVSLANTPASASSADSQKLARLEREIADLKKDRSRTSRFSGRGRGNGPMALPNVQQLALPAPASSSAASTPISRGKGRRGKGGRGNKKVVDKTRTWQFTDLLRGPRAIRGSFHGGRDNSIWYNFQEGKCTLGEQCKREHRCIGRGGPNPYNDCHCLQQKIHNLP